MSAHQIADELKYSPSWIIKCLHDYNIPIRSVCETQRLRRGYNIKSKDLYKLYVTDKRSMNYISTLYNCSYSTIYYWLCRYNISIRSPSESLKKELNPNWKGGISEQNYCYKFNESFKEHIREKFNRTCYICGKSEENLNKKLCVHHIDYNKNAICNGKEFAFVPLCHSCHSKTNGNRWYWFNLLINYWLDKYEIPWVM